MNKKLLTFPLAIGALALCSANAAILINFTGGTTDYTSDGTNTWQTIFYDADGNGNFEAIGETALVDTGNNPTDYTFALGGADNGDAYSEFGNGGAEEAEFGTPPAGFNWFDPASAEQRSTSALNDASAIIYTFGGFQATDQVEFSFVFGRSSGSGNRRIDFGLNANNGSLLDDVQTAGVGVYVSSGTLTGSTSYSFYAAQSSQSDSPSSVVNAMQIAVVPEPSTYALLAGFGALGLVILRRRLK